MPRTDPAPGPSARERALLVGALTVAAFLVAFGALHYGFFTQNLLLDTPIYQRYGNAIVHAQEVPYRDFTVEYPPGALPVFAAPSLVAAAGDFDRYQRAFEVLMLVCGAAASALAGFVLLLQRAPRPRLAVGTLLAGLAPLALGPVVLSRYDLWPAALTIAALALIVAARHRLGCAALGVAIAAKVYPFVLVPLVLAYVARRAGRREAAVCAGMVAAAVAAFVVPFLLVAPRGVWESLSGQATRPLQIETIGAAVLLAAHQAADVPLAQVSSHGSDNLVGRVPDVLAATQSTLAAVTILALWLTFARGEPSRDRLLRFAAAEVCAFIALGKVLSPQYLIWLIPLVPLVRGRRGAAAAVLFVAAMVLTQLWFPYRYIELVYELDPRASWLVLARDLVLVALLLALVWPERAARAAGVTLVAGLSAVAAAAVAAAAVSSPAPAGLKRTGLLAATGVASSCGRPKTPPRTTPGSVDYDAASFVNPGSSRRCVRVSVTAEGRRRLFSVAYGPRFDPARPAGGYLGDLGICTNLTGATRATATYAVDVPPGSFIVVVEACSSNERVGDYTLNVTVGPLAARFLSSAAAKSDDGVLVRWRVGSAAPATTFDVYREWKGVKTAIGSATYAGGRTTYAFHDARAEATAEARYWILATTAGDRWAWHGPIVPRG